MDCKTRWIVQKNLTSPKILKQLQTAIINCDAAYEEITIVPFSDELDYKDDGKKTKLVVYGSTTLMHCAYKNKHLKPGVFYDPDRFQMQHYLNIWQGKMLNSDSIIKTVGEFAESKLDSDELWFVRPNDDTKSFSGMLIGFNKFKEMTKNIAQEIVSPNPYLSAASLVLLSKPKSIAKEWRNFIVEAKVIASTRYCKNGELDVDADDVPSEMIRFTEDCSREYSPHDVFVMDVGLYDGEYKIIECNCFNGTGFYDHDIEKIVSAVHQYLEKREPN